jgi:hypothetical protein
MSLQTLLLLRELLHGLHLNVGDANFSATAQAVLVALSELEEAIAATQREES